MPLTRPVLAMLAAVAVGATSLAGCAPAPKTTGDFCSVYASTKGQLEGASTWVDSKGNVDVVKAAGGIIQLVSTIEQLKSVAPPKAKASLDVIMSTYDGLKTAVASGDQARVQKAAMKFADPSVQKAFTTFAQEAAKACA